MGGSKSLIDKLFGGGKKKDESKKKSSEKDKARDEFSVDTTPNEFAEEEKTFDGVVRQLKIDLDKKKKKK